MKLDWVTDPHLDHLPTERELIEFVKLLHNRDSDGLLITGDIAESPTIYEFLGIISGAYQRPVFFVLGNHDYYRAWMAETRERVRAVCEACPPGILNWLTESEPLHLKDDVWIAGHDGWYDGLCGLGMQSQAALTDFVQAGVFDLADAARRGKLNLFLALKKLGSQAARAVEEQLHSAVEQGGRRILVLTHFPPFWETSFFRGRRTSANYAPFYVNKSMGDVLEAFAEEHPNVKLEVFAGHTHGKCEVPIRDNLIVRVGSARYSHLPQFQEQVLI